MADEIHAGSGDRAASASGNLPGISVMGGSLLMLGSGRFAGGGPCGRRRRSSPAAGGPSQGIVLACRRPRMASACWLASSWDRRSNAKLMDCRSWRRNSGLMCCPNRAGSPAAGRPAPALFRRRARGGERGDPGSGRPGGGVPVPVRHRHVPGRLGADLGVLHRQPGPPLDVGAERGAEFGVVGQPGLGGLLQQRHPTP